MDEMTIYDLCDMFGLDQNHMGVIMWLYLVHEIQRREQPNLSGIMLEVCKIYHCSLHFAYACMRSGCRNFFEADEGFLRAVGFSPKRRTGPEFARQAAEKFPFRL